MKTNRTTATPDPDAEPRIEAYYDAGSRPQTEALRCQLHSIAGGERTAAVIIGLPIATPRGDEFEQFALDAADARRLLAGIPRVFAALDAG